MRSTTYKSALIKSGLAASVLLLASGASFAQSVSLTAAATTTTLPDGSVVPMWGYSCSAAAVAPATCASLNANAAVGTWSPVVITVRPAERAATAGEPRPVVLHAGAAGSYDGAELGRPQARHLPDRVGHAPLDPRSDGPVWNPGCDDRACRHDRGMRISRRHRRDLRGDLQRGNPTAAQ